MNCREPGRDELRSPEPTGHGRQRLSRQPTSSSSRRASLSAPSAARPRSCSSAPLTSSGLQVLGCDVMSGAITEQLSEPGLLSRRYAALTGGLFALCAFVAFEATAVVTI